MRYPRYAFLRRQSSLLDLCPSLHGPHGWLDRAAKRSRAVLIFGVYRVVDHGSLVELGWGTARATTHGTRKRGKSGEHMIGDAATLDGVQIAALGSDNKPAVLKRESRGRTGEGRIRDLILWLSLTLPVSNPGSGVHRGLAEGHDRTEMTLISKWGKYGVKQCGTARAGRRWRMPMQASVLRLHHQHYSPESPTVSLARHYG